VGEITAPEPLTPEHNTACFHCGVASLDDWLRKQALRNEVSGETRTYVVTDGDKVIGFYSFSTGRVICGKGTDAAPSRTIPVLVLGRLAVDSSWQGRGLGFGLLKDAVVRSLYVARKIDIRALVVHTLNDQIKNFYARYGFTELTIDPMVLTLPGSEEACDKLLARQHSGRNTAAASQQ
jgi:GNAT superfamily N-acetyltransferase